MAGFCWQSEVFFIAWCNWVGALWLRYTFSYSPPNFLFLLTPDFLCKKLRESLPERVSKLLTAFFHRLLIFLAGECEMQKILCAKSNGRHIGLHRPSVERVSGRMRITAKRCPKYEPPQNVFRRLFYFHCENTGHVINHILNFSPPVNKLYWQLV